MSYQNTLSVKGSIPAKGKVNIFGYTGANDTVTAVSPRVYSETSSDENGYFSFTDIAIDAQTKEICVSSIDKDSQVSHPTCVPITSGSTVGPVILSPTISLGNSGGLPTEVAISGQTTPLSDVNILLSRNTPYNKLVLIKEAVAASGDNTIKSDKYGYYSINIPITSGDKLRLFSRSLFQSNHSPPSSTLTISRKPIPFFSLILTIAALCLILSILASKYIIRNRKRQGQNVAVQN